MKHQRTLSLTCLLLCLAITVSFAQQAFLIHQDNVKPSKVMQYEKIAKEFHEACLEHKPETNWMAAMTYDFKYFYITPIENMAEMDERPMAKMAEAMGDKFGDMFEEFDKCYDSHGSYIVVSDKELSYMPEDGKIPEGHNYRKWFYIYYTPENAKAIRDGMKAVKALYETKNSTAYYRIYRNGFGQVGNYYLVSVAAKDEVDYAQTSKDNEKALGTFEERWEAFSQVMDYATEMEEYSGEMRPDLSYSHKKDE
ncbi:hypothetical protein [Hyunsoonleella ulvae]|uniref:hypothetical protein n=1 Tax=Hyunsoonleella ulvae TaxID=2799948 RepID=UPI00193A6491|nr:hypothetical protein [Hyunsoonleella ulvae]